MHNFKELIVWNKVIDLSISSYKLSQSFNLNDKYILSSQLCRCAFSIASNIAEGAGKESAKDFCRYISIAVGSSFELETQLRIISGIMPDKKENLKILSNDVIIIQKMLYRLMNKLKAAGKS